MPIYEYRCAKCGDFDVMQKITEKPLRKCPTCKGKVSKLLSNTAFQLKGTGWYVTDYAGKGKGGGESKSEGSASSGSGESAKSEAGSTAGGDGKEAKKAKGGDKGSAPSSSPTTT